MTWALQKMLAVESGQAYPPRYNESIISKINPLVVAPTRIKFKSASLHAKSHNGSCAYVMSSEVFLENLSVFGQIENCFEDIYIKFKKTELGEIS